MAFTRSGVRSSLAPPIVRRTLELSKEIPSGWAEINDRLHREFEFSDFVEAFGFMSRVALLAEQRDHHPNWSNVYNRVVVDLSTHDADNTVTDKDIELALAINRLI